MAAQLATLAQYVTDLANLGRLPAVVETGVYRTTTHSYAEVVGRAFAFRDELWRNYIGAGERLLLWGEPGAAWVSAFYGCVLAGVVVVPLDAAFSPEYVARIQAQTAARLLCCPRERGSAVPGVATYPLEDVLQLPVCGGPQTVMAAAPEALLEIVYTSGATADPKGVMITHGNLLANLRPIAREVQRYRGWARPFLPLRFVHLIPLSHLFGQTLGVFIPPLLDGAVVYPSAQTPSFLAATIRRQRASVLVCVPRQLQLLRAWVLAELRLTREQVMTASAGRGVLRRWWQWRRVHRRLGWKMWAFVVGAAALPAEEEEFWSALGYAVIQGYGLTETAPAVAITHPFKVRRGAVGRKLAGMEIRIAPDGEILVRGPNVSPGYFGDVPANQSAYSEGWLHTGDLGRLDERGDLFFLGRKKEVIVTAEGLNVFPQDVERVLDAQPDIVESAVVADRRGGQESVFAVLIAAGHADADALEAAVARANQQLEPHQRVRGIAAWPDARLPRTASTQKLQRVAIAAWVNGNAATRTASSQDESNWKQFVAVKRGWGVERITPEMRLTEDLALSSLDRVELLSWIETHAGVPADEAEFNQITTAAELDIWLEAVQSSRAPVALQKPLAAVPTPRATLQAEVAWPHRAPVRRLRNLVLYLAVLPALRLFVRVRVSGRENLAGLGRPVLFVANHQSILDVPVLVRALPRRFRPWLAPAMGVGHFAALLRPHSSRAARRQARRQLVEARAFFGAYLLSEETGVQRALRYTGQLANQGYCPLIFPEGERSRDGRLLPFRPGIGIFVRELGLPVVPVVLEDVYKLLPTGATGIRRGTARVRFGQPLQFAGESPESITRRLEAWFKAQTD